MLPGMRSLLRLLIAFLLLGTAIQQGWLQAGTRFVTAALGGPGTSADVGHLDVMLPVRSLLAAVGTLPDPWYSLVVTTCGIIVLVFLGSVISRLVCAASRLAGWVRDVWA